MLREGSRQKLSADYADLESKISRGFARINADQKRLKTRAERQISLQQPGAVGSRSLST